MTTLSDRAGILIAANIIKFSIGILSPLVLVRLISQSDYGTYQQMVLVADTAISILCMGLPTSIYYFYKQGGTKRSDALVIQTTLMLAVAGVVAFLVIAFFGEAIAESFHNPQMGSLLTLYGLSVGLLIASEHSLPVLIARNQYGLTVMFEVCETVVRVLMMLIPLWMGFGLPGVIVSIVVFSALRFLVRTGTVFSGVKLTSGGLAHSFFIRDQLSYGVPIAMISLAVVVGGIFNRGLLAASFTADDYAVFAIGSMAIPFANIFQNAVANVLRAEMPPLVQEGRLSEVARIISESVRKLSLIALPSFVFLFVHAHEFITVLFTSSYARSVDIFRISVWALPLEMLILSPIPQVFGKTRANMYINFAVTAQFVLFSLLLIDRWGMHGAALAAVSSMYFGVFLFFVVAIRLTRSSLSKLMPLPHLLRVLLASMLSAAMSRLLLVLIPDGVMSLFAAGATFAVVFALLVMQMRILTEGDRELMRRWAAKVNPFHRPRTR